MITTPNSPRPNSPGERRLAAQFRDAFRGLGHAWFSERNMAIHAAAAVAVVAVGWWLQVSRVDWCLLVLSMAVVVAAELVNTAIEYLARAMTDEEDERIGRALDISSGAVLITALGAAVVGVIVFFT